MRKGWVLFLLAMFLIGSGVSAAGSETGTPMPQLVARTASNDFSNLPAPAVADETHCNISSAEFTSVYMTNYQNVLSYTVPITMRVSCVAGFEPVDSLVNTPFVFPNGKITVTLPAIPDDLLPYKVFPDVPDKNYPEKQAWGTKPIASYRDGDNWFCDNPDGWCADAVDAFNWIVWTGEKVCHPAVGCLENPGGAVMILLVNFHDSDEAWDARNITAVYGVAGFAGFGRMFDLSGGSYDVGMGIATLRNHYLYNLAFEPEYAGQCGSSALCGTIRFAVVARVWDRPEIGINYSHYELLDSGIWTRK